MHAMSGIIAILALLALAALGVFSRRRPDTHSREAAAAPATGPDPDYPVEIGTELDLHGVPEREVDDLVRAFLDLAREREWAEVKIIHGKGSGRRRARVRALLARHPAVARYGDAASPGSGWGATVVILAPAASEVAPPPGAD
jgi:dsDNA-specific endonuclease/ATPase MutS2